VKNADLTIRLKRNKGPVESLGPVSDRARLRFIFLLCGERQFPVKNADLTIRLKRNKGTVESLGPVSDRARLRVYLFALRGTPVPREKRGSDDPLEAQ